MCCMYRPCAAICFPSAYAPREESKLDSRAIVWMNRGEIVAFNGEHSNDIFLMFFRVKCA